MRRTALALILIAAVVGIHACAADAPTAPRPGTGGGNSPAVSVQLFTTDANPKAGTCTLIEALVSLNGTPAPDGTSVNFSTDFGTFGQNGLPLVSVVTTNGAAAATLCGASAGTAKVKGTATVTGRTNSGNLTISFQSGPGSGPQVSSCSPSFGPKEGGTTVTLNGTGFPASAPGTTRVQFTANGVTKDGVVTSVSSTAVVVQTPGFPELSAPTTPAPVTLTFNGTVPPVVLSLPSCFYYGSTDPGTPTVTAVLPSSGTNEGNTRVTIIGSGFSTGGVQVFFGTVEATVISVSYNQVLALSPRVSIGGDNLNASVPVTVKNIGSGLVSNATVNFTYTPAVKITAYSNNVQILGGPYVPVKIYGQGFQAPVAVSLAGWAALVQSVSSTEIDVIPGNALPTGCSDITGEIKVVNIDTGDFAAAGSFTYLVPKPAITGISPLNSCVDGTTCAPNAGAGGGSAVISGIYLPDSIASAEVKFGTLTAFPDSASSTSLTVTIPLISAVAPTCTGANTAGTPQLVSVVDVTVLDRDTGCVVTAAQAFQYIQPCVIPAP
jgi:hypothetical protein